MGCCGHDIHRSGWEKHQAESVGDTGENTNGVLAQCASPPPRFIGRFQRRGAAGTSTGFFIGATKPSPLRRVAHVSRPRGCRDRYYFTTNPLVGTTVPV